MDLFVYFLDRQLLLVMKRQAIPKQTLILTSIECSVYFITSLPRHFAQRTISLDRTIKIKLGSMKYGYLKNHLKESRFFKSIKSLGLLGRIASLNIPLA
jgi:hypothetical protein